MKYFIFILKYRCLNLFRSRNHLGCHGNSKVDKLRRFAALLLFLNYYISEDVVMTLKILISITK